jgi:TorA maturation chaperone TorD
MSALLSSQERAPIDLLLSRLLLEELDAGLVETLAREEIVEILERVEPAVRASVNAPWTEAREAAAREEYARLFLLPKGVPPFASAWLEGEREQLGAQLTSFVSRVMKVLDRESSDRHGNLPLDHLGLLLELAATASVDPRETHRTVGEHLRAQALGPWVARFGDALRTQARLPSTARWAPYSRNCTVEAHVGALARRTPAWSASRVSCRSR